MDNLLTSNEVCQRLNIDYDTLYRYIRAGKLPATKLGGSSARHHYRIKEHDLVEFINKGE